MVSPDETTPLLSNQRQRGLSACNFIVVSVFLERLAYYGLAGNLVFYLSKGPLCVSYIYASTTFLAFKGVKYFVGLIAGLISDSYLGQYKTLCFGFTVYIIGYAFLSDTGFYTSCDIGDEECNEKFANYSISHSLSNNSEIECPNLFPKSSELCDSNSCFQVVCVSLVMIAIGSGVIQTCMAPFGGDQVRDQGAKATSKFFTKFYWAINAGILAAYAGVVVLQQSVNFFYGFITPLAALLLAFVIFLFGHSLYIKTPGKNRTLCLLLKIYKDAMKNKKYQRSSDEFPNLLDYAKRRNGGNFDSGQVDDVKKLWKIAWTNLLLIPYWICYSQMFGNIFLLQGLHLRVDLDVNSNCSNSDVNDKDFIDGIDDYNCHIAVPAATLSIFSMVFILITLPIVNMFYQLLSSCGVAVPTWTRMCNGMILSCFALVSAGILETCRMDDIHKNHNKTFKQYISNTVYDSAPHISVWYQIPQYCLLGASEVLTVLTAIEHCYMTAPQAMQGFIMGLFWVTAGIGDIAALSLTFIFQGVGWFNPTYYNLSSISYYFFLLAGVLFAWTMIFILMNKCGDLGLNRVAVAKEAVAQPIPTPQLYRRRQAVNRSRSNSDIE